MSSVTASSILKEGNTAVITGASSGIGRAMAIECSTRGMNVWMIDIDKEELEVALDMVKSKAKDADKQKLEARVIDVSDWQQMASLAHDVFEGDGACHFLFNNAGIGKGGGPITTSMDTFHNTLGVNTYGPIHGCIEFVPKMKASKQPGLIVNTGSKQGITMPPGNLTYNVSKAALKCYTEGLQHELRTNKTEYNDLLRAALLVPGWVNTSIMLKSIRDDKKQKGETFDKDKDVFFHEDKPANGAWMPKQIVDFMISELDENANKFYVICPDNDVDRETDNLRMTWTMGDITNDRPPLSRWHDDFKDEFSKFLEANKKK